MNFKYLWLAGVMVVLFISGCGGGGSNDSPGGGAPAPAITSDAFTQAVRELAAGAPDNTEPVNINAIEVTSSETAEPEPI